MTASGTLLLVGCGKMGSALLTRAAPLMSSIFVIEPAATPAKLPPNVTWLSTLDKIAPNVAPDIITIAIKPQQMANTLPAYAKFQKAAYLSIAAGITLAKLKSLLGNDKAPIIRAMPNLPASIGQGMTVACANENVTATQRALCEKILTAIGATAWTTDENLMDAVTALSGSGPAYVFALCEAMTAAGEKAGLPKDMAEQLARQTIIGSGALLAQSPDSTEALRIAVTSPGGTTEAALKILQSNNALTELMSKTIAAAATRAKELAQ